MKRPVCSSTPAMTSPSAAKATADGTTKNAMRSNAASIRRDSASNRAPGARSRAASPDMAGSSEAEMAMPNRLTGSV